MSSNKHLLFAFLPLFIAAVPAMAQTTEEAAMRTLFGSEHDLHHGGWGAPTATYTRIMDQDAMLVGLRGGWIIDHRLTIGLAGHGLVTPMENKAYDSYLLNEGVQPHRRSEFRTGYGGLLIEPVIAYKSPIHISLPVLIGAGGCGYQTYTGLHEDFDPDSWHDEYEAFFVIEPGVDLEFNLVKLVGLRGGWIIDHRLTIGLAGHGLVTPVENKAYDSYLLNEGVQPHRRSEFRTGYGGLLIEPVIAYKSPIHISLPVLIGAGGCGYQTYTGLHEDFDPDSWHDEYEAFFVIEPGVDLEFNLVKLVKLGLGASYRYTSDIKLPETPEDAMRGFNASMSIKIGVF